MSEMDLVCYEHDQGFVLEQFQDGTFDYLDAASEVVETEFFRFIGANRMLKELAKTYPSPRKKEQVPVWFYVASNLSMRLHGVHSFNAYPYVVRCGGMLNAFGAEIAHKATHPETGDVTLSCSGFNDKNDYDRQTPCDQDTLRKLARDTPADELMRWYNTEVAKILKVHKAFDPEGIFIGDGSYIFVPDNPAYEKSVKLLFDESNHPIDADDLKAMSPEKVARCQWRRCYKMVSLFHTDREGTFFLRVAMTIVPGNVHEDPVFYELLRTFVKAVGPGVIKRLLLDRGFIDGPEIGRCKQEHKIDVLIPLKKNMDIYKDALGLMKLPQTRFVEVPSVPSRPVRPPRLPSAPEPIRRREAKRQQTLKERQAQQPPPNPKDTVVIRDAAGIQGFTSFESCPVPLNVIINRETYGDGHQDIWMLLDTKTWSDPDAAAVAGQQDYHLRTRIEEGHRQWKCFWDLTGFTSRAFSLVVNQIIFVALAYNLLQLYLKRSEKREELNRRTRPIVQRQLLPNASWVIIYCQNRFALLTVYEYTELLFSLTKLAQEKIAQKIRRIKSSLAVELAFPRPP